MAVFCDRIGHVIVGTDGSSTGLISNVLGELSDQGRLLTLNLQTVSVRNVQSATTFGNSFANFHDFSKTLSTVLRMAMLRCTNVPQYIWETQLTAKAADRNIARFHYYSKWIDRRDFKLAELKEDARYYWSRFDQLFPPSRIEDKMRGAGVGESRMLSGTILLIARDFEGVVQISVYADITKRDWRGTAFDTVVKVMVLHYDVLPLIDGPWMTHLKKLLHNGASFKKHVAWYMSGMPLQEKALTFRDWEYVTWSHRQQMKDWIRQRLRLAWK
ncbi:uncharacterized protein LOC121390656 [Gigantopelta aegis]|uniref:uncharacterized protein LOC121390656 n=1 Tax=Gigantopelta aegis TaxID=1735272 RepID=UPI001B88C316|nr:uncharacterized protein LOC121390656 [Gigantopelta aegis]